MGVFPPIVTAMPDGVEASTFGEGAVARLLTDA